MRYPLILDVDERFGGERVDNSISPVPGTAHSIRIAVSEFARCGSDPHLYDGYIPGMYRGDILGHEFMGEVVELGTAVQNLQIGDRVVVPFPISCGNCFFCERELF